MNLASILLLIVVIIWLIAALIYLHRNGGCHGCGGNCSECSKRCKKR